MAFRAIIADWNGTLISDRNELPILKHIAVGIARHLFPFHPIKLAKIFKAKGELDQTYAKAKDGKDFDYVRDMYEIYNRKIIKGTTMSVVRDAVEAYANREDVQGRLDYRILNVLRKYHGQNKKCGILSAGYDYGIDRILIAAGHRSSFEFICADGLVESDGKAERLLLQIYRNKGTYLRKLMEEHEIDPDETAYIGDTQDDENCFQLIGYPIVSFFAPDDFKKKCANEYNAFVPESEKELVQFFKRIDK